MKKVVYTIADFELMVVDKYDKLIYFIKTFAQRIKSQMRANAEAENGRN